MQALLTICKANKSSFNFRTIDINRCLIKVKIIFKNLVKICSQLTKFNSIFHVPAKKTLSAFDR